MRRAAALFAALAAVALVVAGVVLLVSRRNAQRSYTGPAAPVPVDTYCHNTCRSHSEICTFSSSIRGASRTYPVMLDRVRSCAAAGHCRAPPPQADREASSVASRELVGAWLGPF